MKPEQSGEEADHQRQCHDPRAGFPQGNSLDGFQSASPTNYVSQDLSVGNNPQTMNMEQRTTIDKPTKNGGDYSDSISHSQQSAQHLAFHPSYDSEESDTSIVFSQQAPPVNSDSSPRLKSQHSRFPSFDSVASTGSFKVLPPAPSPYGSQSPYGVAAKPPAMLPYDQRRKLQLQRVQQQQYSQHYTTQPQRQDPPIRQHFYAPAPQHPAYASAHDIVPGTDPQNQNDQSAHVQSPQMYAGMYVPGPPQQNPQQQLPPSGYRGSQGKQPQKLETIRKGSNRLPNNPQHGYHHQPPIGPSHSLPPIGNHRNYSGYSSRGRTASADSTSPEKERPSRYGSKLRETGPPPPPPPPPPLPAYHLRADSSGSISSLGSSGGGPAMASLTDTLDGDIAGFLDQEKVDSKSGNFVEGLMSYLSPETKQRRYSVEHFHQQNQKFLQHAKRQQSSPRQTGKSPRLVSNRANLRADTPPRSRGGHRRLTSIENDEWEEQDASARWEQPNNSATTGLDALSSSEVSDSCDVDERTSLLPPSGISTREYTEDPRKTSNKEKRRSRRSERHGRYMGGTGRERRRSDRMIERNEDPTMRFDNRSAIVADENSRRSKKHQRKKSRKNERRRSRRYKHAMDSDESESTDNSISSSSEDFDYRQWTKKRARMLEKERAKLIAQWKAEAQSKAEYDRSQRHANRWYNRFGRSVEEAFTTYLAKTFRFFALLETFISNLPLTIGAVALAIVTLGVVWFKFAEENLDSCEPVRFHSSQCTFPEFPGCFYCDTDARMYKVAVNFHFACSAIAGILSLTFVLKVILATRVVLDELSSPTTASPAGLICMTTVCVFAGRGWIGQFLVSVAAATHLCLAIWFIYCALAYHIMPEPSWFPNTVGIGLSAVKTWLYYPMSGHLLMAISLALNFFFFPISLIRVTLNEKISAPVGWIQMSAPAISLYALTIMAQPSFEEEHPDVTKFERVHRMIYLPCMHFLFALAVLGVVSSVQSLCARWDDFKKKEFSPAHAAFCFPTLAHANAIQAYRAAVNTFSDIPSGSPFKIALYTYWVVVLVTGTVATIYVTGKFFYMLPTWTQIDVADEVEPPAPYETSLTLQDVIATGETMRQPFVSPAVLQANETGALVMLPRGADGRNRYIRTRRLPALGFEPTMNWSELNRERELLLDWVGKNPPRRRKRTLSVPGIDFNYGYGDFGSGNSGVFGSEAPRHSRGVSFQPQRSRSNSSDGFQYY